MSKAMLTYQGGRKKVEAGVMSESVFQQMQNEGLIGPSPTEERVALFPENRQESVRAFFTDVENFNATISEGPQLRLQVIQAKETSE